MLPTGIVKGGDETLFSKEDGLKSVPLNSNRLQYKPHNKVAPDT